MYQRRAKNDALAKKFEILGLLFDTYQGDSGTVDSFWKSVISLGIDPLLLGQGDRAAVKNFRRDRWVVKILLVNEDLLRRSPDEKELIFITRPKEVWPIEVQGTSVGTRLLSAEHGLFDGSVVISLRQEGSELMVTLYKSPKEWTLKAWVKKVREAADLEVKAELAGIDAEEDRILDLILAAQ